MDIQKMVDDRMEELRFRKMRAASPLLIEERILATKDSSRHERRRDDNRSSGYDSTSSESPSRQTQELSGLAKLVDGSLVEVAERVLAITERVAGDYSRMEKDILDSRLAVLQSAEEVLDIAITLRRKARRLLPSPLAEMRDYRKVFNKDAHRVIDTAEDLAENDCLHDRRASMHEQGVASLFRKT